VSSSARDRRAPDSLGTYFSFSIQQTALIAIVALTGLFWLGHDLPRIPLPTPDTQSYLEFAVTRPHGYSWFLAAYRLIFEDFAYLAHVQLGLFVLAVFFLGYAVGRRSSTVVLPLIMQVLIFLGIDTTEFPYLMSDLVYAAALIAGVACFMLYVAGDRPISLVLGSVLFGLAVTFRSIGPALLLGLFIAVVAHCISRERRFVPTFLLGVLPATIILGGAIMSQYAINGRLVIGSASGWHVLGKLPLLSKPASANTRFGLLNDIIEDMAPARRQLAQLNPLVEALAARQYYEYLRWHVIVPELDRVWTDWRNGDDHERGLLAVELAKVYIAENPLGLLRRTGIELLGLWTMPRWLSPGERSAALKHLESVGELPFLGEFSRTPEGQYEFYRIIPSESAPPVKLAVFRFAVVGFWLLTLGLIAAILRQPRRTACLMPDIILIVVAVHAIYAGTALMEGVHERYVMPTWPLLVSGPMLALGLLWRSARRKRPSVTYASGAFH
jgi:hypothetical protein